MDHWKVCRACDRLRHRRATRAAVPSNSTVAVTRVGQQLILEVVA